MSDENEKIEINESDLADLMQEASADQMQEPGAPMASQEPVIKTSEIVSPVVQLLFGLFYPGQPLEPEENATVSEAYAALLDKYFPNVAGKFGVEVNAIIITGMIVMPRMAAPKTEKPARVKSETGDSVMDFDQETFDKEKAH